MASSLNRGARYALLVAAGLVPQQRLGYHVAEFRGWGPTSDRMVQLRVSVPEHYAEAELQVLGARIRDSLARREAFAAMRLSFFCPHTITQTVYTLARLDWNVRGHAGWQIDYITPVPQSNLPVSRLTGPEGTPIPEGARPAGRRPVRGLTQYLFRSHASPEQLESFYHHNLRPAGYLLISPPRIEGHAIHFCRGSREGSVLWPTDLAGVFGITVGPIDGMECR